MNQFLKCPVEHIQIQLDPANTVTGLLANLQIGDTVAKVKATFYIKTQAAAGQLIDIGYGATINAQTTNILDGGSAISGAQGGLGETIVCLTAIVPPNYYITAFNVATNTPTIATAIVGWLDLEITRYPVIVGDQ